jgi:exosome complex component MTR3
MRPPPRLSNCYIPLQIPVPQQSLNGINEPKCDNESVLRRKMNILSERKLYKSTPKQSNQRNTHELRRVRIESNVIQSSNSSSPISGSSMVELGQTKVLCTVIGPVTATCPAVPSTTTLSIDIGTIHVRVSYLPTTSSFPIQHIPIITNSLDSTITSTTLTSSSQQQHQQQAPPTPRLTPKLYSNFIQQRERDLSKRITTAISAAIPLHQYPKNVILIQLTILYDDGCIIPACITAITIALMDASIELYDTITCCTVAIVTIPNIPLDDDTTSSSTETIRSSNIEMQSIVIADPTINEMSIADSIVTIAMLPNWDEVTLWEQKQLSTITTTSNSTKTTNRAIEWCQDGCRTMYQFIREHLVQQQQPHIPKQMDDISMEMELGDENDDMNTTSTKKRKITSI